MGFLVVADDAGRLRTLGGPPHATAGTGPDDGAGGRGPAWSSSASPAPAATPSAAPTAAGTLGPDLTDVGSRQTLGAVTVPNTPANLARLDHATPSASSRGTSMPPIDLQPDEIAALVAYLESLQ